MGKSKSWKNGGITPDWLDVEAALRVIAELYSVTTMVTILPDGIGSSGGLKIAITSHWDIPGNGNTEGTVITARHSQCYSPESLPAFVLGGIVQHDYEMSISYPHQNNAS